MPQLFLAIDFEPSLISKAGIPWLPITFSGIMPANFVGQSTDHQQPDRFLHVLSSSSLFRMPHIIKERSYSPCPELKSLFG